MPRVLAMLGALALRDAKGIAAVEFAIIGPVLLLILVGLFVFGIALNNYVILTNAAESGALQFAISRGDSSPWTNTRNAIFNAAPTLPQANLTITLSVNGTVCASDSACQTALTANEGKPAVVQASYPCIPSNPNLTAMGVNYAPNCTMRLTVTERIQ